MSKQNELRQVIEKTVISQVRAEIEQGIKERYRFSDHLNKEIASDNLSETLSLLLGTIEEDKVTTRYEEVALALARHLPLEVTERKIKTGNYTTREVYDLRILKGFTTAEEYLTLRNLQRQVEDLEKKLRG